ncbi:MAG: ATP-binding protein [Dehalococcoidia bacterium]
MEKAVKNPFRPGAGHDPPYLAGRGTEKAEFAQFLKQDRILDNVILTGLRGVGKTVLLEGAFKPMAIREGWIWVGTDVSESSSVTEETLAIRLMTDLSVVTSSLITGVTVERGTGLAAGDRATARTLDFHALVATWQATNGLSADKLKAVLETAWASIAPLSKKGVIFAYDEAQNLADHAGRREYPLSLLLDVFQSLQKRGIPFMLVLTGLPTLFPKLVDARTFAERMFHVMTLERLDDAATRDAIMKPIKDSGAWVSIAEGSVPGIYNVTRGYPYFIQFVCRELYDVWTQQAEAGEELRSVPWDSVMRKLDADFFSGRWARVTDRQRDLMWVIAQLENAESEFSVQDIVRQSAMLPKPFSGSHVSQMLIALADAGLVYKNRWGKYSLAVPLLDQFIKRQMASL